VKEPPLWLLLKASSLYGRNVVWALLLLETELAGKYNPFRPDKIVPPGLFCGRIEEINFLDHCLLQAKQGNAQHFLIEGERGIGNC
jgi:hypothetical protein